MALIATRNIVGFKGDLLTMGQPVPNSWDQGTAFFQALLQLGAVVEGPDPDDSDDHQFAKQMIDASGYAKRGHDGRR